VTTRVAIDLNVRVHGNQTYAGLEDVTGPLAIGSHVEVYEPETGLVGPAEVTEVDQERRLVYLAVDWGKLREPPSAGLSSSWAEVVLRHLVAALRQLANAVESSRMTRR
jgi:hypothetical protein